MHPLPSRLVAAFGAAILSSSLLPPSAANASLLTEQLAVAAVNAARIEHGLSPVAVNAELRSSARRHSAAMISRDRLFHSDLGELDGRTLAENVGFGASVDDISSAFMASELHRANLLDPAMTQIGVAVDYDDGLLWVTQILRRPR